jgi:hypothetical protein
LGEPKTCQAEEDKILVEDPSSIIYQQTPIIWKGLEEGRQGSTRSFQSKETIMGLGGSVLGESGMLLCS